MRAAFASLLFHGPGYSTLRGFVPIICVWNASAARETKDYIAAELSENARIFLYDIPLKKRT